MLVDLGYEFTGIDINARAISKANHRLAGRARILRHDMRDLDGIDGGFDAVLLLWQSFGHFDEQTNRDIVQSISNKLAPGGRFILDIYHRGFFEQRQGTRIHEKLGRQVVETKHMRANRLTVKLKYDDQKADIFEWQVYAPDEII